MPVAWKRGEAPGLSGAVLGALWIVTRQAAELWSQVCKASG